MSCSLDRFCYMQEILMQGTDHLGQDIHACVQTALEVCTAFLPAGSMVQLSGEGSINTEAGLDVFRSDGVERRRKAKEHQVVHSPVVEQLSEHFFSKLKLSFRSLHWQDSLPMTACAVWIKVLSQTSHHCHWAELQWLKLGRPWWRVGKPKIKYCLIQLV